jgi:hypothetical protein
LIQTFDVPKHSLLEIARLIDRLAAGRPIRVEIMSLQVGDQEAETRLPFLGIDYDPKGGSVGENFTITAGFEGRDEVTHRIFSPTHVYTGVNDVGVTEWVAIEDAAGEKTLIHFESLPELEAETTREAP